MTDVAAPQSTEATSFEELLEYLKLNRGFDFTGYKRSSLSAGSASACSRSASTGSPTTRTTSRSIPTSSASSSTRS